MAELPYLIRSFIMIAPDMRRGRELCEFPKLEYLGKTETQASPSVSD